MARNFHLLVYTMMLGLYLVFELFEWTEPTLSEYQGFVLTTLIFIAMAVAYIADEVDDD